MITINDAEEILKKEYHIDNYTYLLSNVLLPDYTADVHPVEMFNTGSTVFESVTMLGVSKRCEVTIFEVLLKSGTHNRRVAITQEMFRILRGLQINNAIVAFVNEGMQNYRISLLTSKYEFEGEQIVKRYSNPRRLSYSLGYGTKTKTAYKFLIEKGKVNSLDELISRFSVEVVNKQFYSEIATAFTELVGGERNGRKYDRTLKLNGIIDNNKFSEFGVRLIGRIMFCWFLREKRSENGIPLVPDSMLSVDTIKQGSYYHKVLEPLFFELLNTNHNLRKEPFTKGEYTWVPYLNGGLFSPQTDDHYKYDEALQSGSYGVVTIPDEWFERLYSILSDYNFTVDENTAYDIELSIDPEMLGRIFENLLAEINPETGENAKKSTGSFYTPRDIVDYMVDSSLCEYLKTKTDICENKLQRLISYYKDDDEGLEFSTAEKKQLINALYTVTVLDPACGSGAFPIGMLQKIVYILQELDPTANLWFDKATENVSVLLKKEFEKKFNAGSLNYIRKLSVIQNSIFGIDIQPIAVEISRLRCFLSLIIEEKVDDSEENRGINPLPNLDFKFIIANSLIYLGQSTLFEDNALDSIKKLKDIRDEYFTAESKRREELKQAFIEAQNNMCCNPQLAFMSSNNIYCRLMSWSPFDNAPTDWFDYDWMFGIKGGFDIIIGNPPYKLCQPSNTDIDTINYYKKNYTVAKYKIDLFHLFFERGIKMLKNSGVLGYITPNTYLTNKHIMPLRKYILDSCTIHTIINHNKVFESASVDTATIILSKGYNIDNEVTIMQSNGFDFYKVCKKKQFEWKSDEYCVFNINVVEIKISENCICLGKICETYFGIQAYNRKASISANKKNNYCFPIIDGSDIHPYEYAIPKLFFEFVSENIKSGGDWNVHSRERIVVRQIGSTPIVGLCRENILCSNTLFSIWLKSSDSPYDLKFILACLNSSYVKQYWKAKFYDNKATFPKIKGYQLQNLPIPIVTAEQQFPVIDIVNRIIKVKQETPDFNTDSLEAELNQLLTTMYK